jgi:hypothetical protein
LAKSFGSVEAGNCSYQSIRRMENGIAQYKSWWRLEVTKLALNDLIIDLFFA